MNQGMKNTAEWIQIDRLLRYMKTQRYFNGGGWTQDSNQAKSFLSQIDAVHDCIHHGLDNVELVLRAPGGGADLFTTAVR